MSLGCNCTAICAMSSVAQLYSHTFWVHAVFCHSSSINTQMLTRVGNSTVSRRRQNTSKNEGKESVGRLSKNIRKLSSTNCTRLLQ